MSLVQRLSEELANKIAAGEVVERPATVVKELVENAIDAGARTVEVAIEDGGRSRISVVDDGRGMGRQDALLCVERHTTSKLSTDADLFAIRTFGFRGEALASIAAVSRFTLTTRRAEDLAATRIRIEGGRVLGVEEVGAPTGTRIEVEGLFENVPARLKFLKSRPTEVGHVSDWLSRLALARPDVGILFSSDGRSSLKALSTENPKERIAAVLGRELYEAMHEVEYRSGELRVRGFAAGPNRQNATSREIFTFVNGRYVRERALLGSITRAYEGVLQVGRSPSVVVFIELPPAEVDVNVHPQKLEVRFAKGREVMDALYRALRSMLMGSPWLERAPWRQPEPVEPPPSFEPLPPAASDWNPDPALTPQQLRVAAALERHRAQADFGLELPPLRLSDSGARRPEPPPLPVPLFAPPEPVKASPEEAKEGFRFSKLRYLGQIRRTFLVCEGPESELILIDQHAAHERVLYERFRAERAGESRRGQPFLVPLTLEMSPADARLVEAALEELGELGFELEPFGGSTFLLKAAPPELEGADYRGLVSEIASEMRVKGQSDLASRSEEALLVRMACHAAVRAGDPLEPEEARALLETLDGTPFQAQCPHGRPVSVRFEASTLDELFKRTYEGTPKAAVYDRLD